MRVKVTQEHIDRGHLCMAGHCPIALALFELTGLSWHAYGDSCNFELSAPPDLLGETVRIELPQSAQRFIRRFDHATATCKPFTFELRM